MSPAKFQPFFPGLNMLTIYNVTWYKSDLKHIPSFLLEDQKLWEHQPNTIL